MLAADYASGTYVAGTSLSVDNALNLGGHSASYFAPADRAPAAPGSDGTYLMTATTNSGTTTYAWSALSSWQGGSY